MSRQSSANRGEKLAILRCHGCHAALALGDGDSTVCPYCGITVAIPDRYRHLRDAERETAKKRTEAAALYHRLGRPPGLVPRAWGAVSTGFVWLLLWPVAFVVDGLLVAKALEIASRSLRANLYEIWSNTTVFTTIGLFLFLTLAIPLAIGVYGRRRTLARRRVQAALAAMPPERAGFPSSCRTCAAPLDVPKSALGVQCVYCGSDNLVALPESWVHALRSAGSALGTSIESAARSDRDMRRRERRSLAKHLLAASLFVPLLAGYGWLLDREGNSWPPNWSRAVSGERMLLPAMAPEDQPGYVPPPLPLSGTRIGFGFDPSDCSKNGCLRDYLLALRADEAVEITAVEFQENVDAVGIVWYTQTSAVFGDQWTKVGNRQILHLDDTGVFTAPRSGWYRVEVICPTRNPIDPKDSKKALPYAIVQATITSTATAP